MSTSSLMNGLGVLLALGLAIRLGAMDSSIDSSISVSASSVVVDANDRPARVHRFHRIASGSTVVDRLLVELCEPDRIMAFTAYGAEHSPDAHQYAGKARVPSIEDLEGIVALQPDLFILNHDGAPSGLARLRESGVEVFDLGEMRGLSTLLANVRAVAALVGHPDRGERFVENFTRRFDRVAAGLPSGQRRGGLYLAVYGNQLFGGTVGTSYHDVLTHAGLRDVAATRYVDWPHYSSEQLLELNPEVVVTKPGMKQLLCDSATLGAIAACTRGGTVVEIQSELIDDPGPSMLEAAEQIFAATYGK